MTTTAAPVQLTTRSGLVLNVRPATEADAPALTAFFDRVSREDRRFRFLAAGEHVSPEQLEPLVHADHFRSESFLAFDAANGALVASGLLACDNALDTAEVAVSVAEDYKGKGAGWAVLDLLAAPLALTHVSPDADQAIVFRAALGHIRPGEGEAPVPAPMTAPDTGPAWLAVATAASALAAARARMSLFMVFGLCPAALRPPGGCA